MAKLRRNHEKGSKGFGASLTRITIILILLVVGLFLLAPRLKNALKNVQKFEQEDPDDTVEDGRQRIYLPVGPSDQIVHHKYYSLGYDNDWEQARWVAYTLTPQQVNNRNAKRRDDFRPDLKVKDRSAVRDDYRRSGFSRGHLVPAGDMAFDKTAMSETFFYSNMSPQRSDFNGAVWRELEETVRFWVRKKGKTYIVSGPVVAKRPKRIGENGVAIPKSFYKVLLTENGEGIGFLIPHSKQLEPLESYAVTIDKIEQITGLDFFPEQTDLATPELEASLKIKDWRSDEKRYKRRLDSWNRR